jgi:hypothetical protein
MRALPQHNYLLIVVVAGRNLWENAKLVLHLCQHLCAHLMAK